MRGVSPHTFALFQLRLPLHSLLLSHTERDCHSSNLPPVSLFIQWPPRSAYIASHAKTLTLASALTHFICHSRGSHRKPLMNTFWKSGTLREWWRYTSPLSRYEYGVSAIAWLSASTETMSPRAGPRSARISLSAIRLWP